MATELTDDAVRSPTAALYPGEQWVYRAERRWNPFLWSLQGGRLISAIKLPLFRRHTPAGYGVLETIGRKTGLPRQRCVRVIRNGDLAYLVSIGGGYAAWVNNIRAHPQVRLRVNDTWLTGWAGELDSGDVAAARAAYCQTVTPFDYLTCRFHRRGRPTNQKIIELTSAWFDGGLPLVINLEK